MSLREDLADVPMRIETIFHLDTMAIESLPADLEEFMEEHEDVFADMGFTVPEYPDDITHAEWRERLEDALAWQMPSGWIVIAATPVKRQWPDNSGIVYSWAIFATKPFYAKTYEDALTAAMTWARNVPVEHP